MEDKGFTPRALGEIAIRCTDKPAMVAFYRDVIGLKIVPDGHRDGITFLAIGEVGSGFGGHTPVLALFSYDMAGQIPDAPRPETGTRSSLHHIALSLPYAEQQAVMDWYDTLGQPYTVQHFGWVGWRGVFTQDPDGNTVELVAYDASELS